MSAPQGELFKHLPQTEPRTLVFSTIRYPLWTENKAKLIERYLYYFVLITRHGAYIDGFAGPQEEALPDTWAARLVLESKPQFLRNFWLCENDPAGIECLQTLIAGQPAVRGRSISLVRGDFNVTVNDVLGSGIIKESTATFCLLDQRTFECQFETVRRLAEHKTERKIELFYFLATGWLDRALAAVTVSRGQVEKWWGGTGWDKLLGMDGTARADLFCKRFREEFGYDHAYAWPIYKHGATGAVMYHMIHATDHPAAPHIMARAYRKATKAREPAEQLTLELQALINGD